MCYPAHPHTSFPLAPCCTQPWGHVDRWSLALGLALEGKVVVMAPPGGASVVSFPGTTAVTTVSTHRQFHTRPLHARYPGVTAPRGVGWEGRWGGVVGRSGQMEGPLGPGWHHVLKLSSKASIVNSKWDDRRRHSLWSSHSFVSCHQDEISSNCWENVSSRHRYIAKKAREWNMSVSSTTSPKKN